jgi:predicted dehydrogenase
MQAEFFLEAIEKGDAGLCSGERAIDVVLVLEAITQSLRSGGAPVALPHLTPA